MTESAERASADNGRPDVPDAALVAARAADAKLGQGTIVLAMGDLLGVTDAFVITSAANSRQVRTIVEEVESQVKQSLGRSPRATEGLRDLTWVLMDYGDFLVHVFHDDARAYYDLERLWGNAPRLSVTGAFVDHAAEDRAPGPSA
jgi:ribosome-associated protein